MFLVANEEDEGFLQHILHTAHTANGNSSSSEQAIDTLPHSQSEDEAGEGYQIPAIPHRRGRTKVHREIRTPGHSPQARRNAPAIAQYQDVPLDHSTPHGDPWAMIPLNEIVPLGVCIFMEILQ